VNSHVEENPLDVVEMTRHQIRGPSPELRKRVLHAARAAWPAVEPTPADIPWVFPVLRLAASLVAAVSLVHFMNVVGSQTAARWLAFEKSPANADSANVSPNQPMLSRLADVAASLAPKNAPQELINRQRRIQEFLGTAGDRNGSRNVGLQ